MKCDKCGAPVRPMPPDGDIRYDPPSAYAATLAPQEAPIDWQAECDRIYKETGGVTPKLREAYEFYKRTQAAPEKPDFDALATDALRSVDKGVGYKHYHACVKANLIAAYELGWTAARASAETEMADAKSDADNARSLAESRRLGKEQTERELATVKAQRDASDAGVAAMWPSFEGLMTRDVAAGCVEAVKRHRAAKGGE